MLKGTFSKREYAWLNRFLTLEANQSEVKAIEVKEKTKATLVDRDAELAKLIRTRNLGSNDLLDIEHDSFVKVCSFVACL